MNTKIFEDDTISEAAEILRHGGLMAVPTETVYGLAANGFDAEAVERIFTVKGRPENKPLSLMVFGKEAMFELCDDVPEAAEMLADCFWPGPLTIVLKARPGIPDIVRAGGETVGLRCPDHPLTLKLLRELKLPLAAPSANPSGEKSPTEAPQVADYFSGRIEGIIDGGACDLGLESTVIDMSRRPYKILRQGAAAESDINLALMASMTIIGITGGTGCGKTTALDAIIDLGGKVIDCDELYHELLLGCEPMRREINDRFPGALPEGSDNTKALGEIVFNDPAALAQLGAITHRYVGTEITRRLTDWAKMGGRLAAIDAIALIEGGAGNYCKANVGIIAPTEDRIKRLMKRENISREYAELRISAQKSNEYFESVCDQIISNDSTVESFKIKCRQVFLNIIGR